MTVETEKLRNRLNKFITLSKKDITKVTKEMGIAHNTFMDFVKGKRIPTHISQLRMSSYLDREFPLVIQEEYENMFARVDKEKK